MLRRLATSRDRVVRRPRGRRGAGRGTRRRLLALRVRAERRGHGHAWLDGLVQVTQRELERAEKRHDVLERHEAKVGAADELSFHLALTAGHDRVVVVTQDADEIPCVDAGRRTERGHRRRRVALVGEELKVDGLKTASCRAGQVAVTADDRLETFLGHEAERLLERDEYRDCRSRGSLRLLERRLVRGEVEVRLWQVRLFIRLPGARAHRDHRDSGRGAPRFLRSRDADVDTPVVYLEVGASRARHAVDEEELSGITHDRRDVFDRVQDTGRGLVVRDEDGLRGILAFLLRELVAYEIGLDRSAVGDVDAPSVNAVGLADRGEALAERAAAEHKRLVAG